MLQNMLQILDAQNYVCSSYVSPGIPSQLAYVVTLIYKVIQIVVPVLLIIWGMLDLGKAVMAQKEDEIKKGQNTFVKRLITAIIIFFVTTAVKLIINLFAGDSASINTCIDEIISCNNIDAC